MFPTLFLLALGVLAPGGTTTPQAAATTPNVLLIYLDDVSVDLNVALGMYPASPIQTPNIDSLAAQGRRFALTYCPYPLCNPSRVSTLTGQRPTTTGIFTNDDLFLGNTLNGVPTLPYKFRLDGYQVGGAGKIFHNGYVEPGTWHEYYLRGDDPNVPKPQNPVPQDTWKVVYFGPYLNGVDGSLGKMRATKETDDVLGMMSRFPQPFFLAMGYQVNHNPFIYPEAYDSLYDPMADVPPLPAEEYQPDWKSGLDPAAYSSALYLDPNYADPEVGRREATAAYWRTITYVDDEIGRLLQGLVNLGLDQSTIVVLVSDHGWSNGHHGRYGKDAAFDWESRTDLVVRVPWIPADGLATTRPVDHVDLYPTLMELCGLGTPAGLEGESLVPLLLDPTAPFKPAFSINYRGSELLRTVCTGQYKFVFWENGLHQLYDLWNDPGEYHNLFGDSAYDSLVLQHIDLLHQYGVLQGKAFTLAYGDGWPGTLGVPSYGATTPILNSNLVLALANSRGSDTMGLFYLGVNPMSLVTPTGGTLLVERLLAYFAPIPASGLNAVVPLTLMDGWIDASLYFQTLELDPGAPGNISFTRGLRLTFGDH